MPHRLLLAIALGIAAVGGVVLAAGVGESVPTTVHLSQGDTTPTTPTTITLTLGDGTDPSPTTTSSPPTTSTTMPQATTTSTLALPVTTTSTSTSTTLAPNTALVRVVNSFTSTVSFTVNDATSHTWNLAPGETGGPWVIGTATDHNDDAGVTDPATHCGIEQMGPFFESGHSVLITIERAGLLCEAQAGPINGAMFVVLDETTGKTTVVGVPGLPTTG